jgi:Ca-activated chloride channel family protein
MSFGNPWYLLALLLPLLGALALRQSKGSAKDRWPAMTRVAIAGDRLKSVHRGDTRPAVLVLAAVGLAIIALAQPRWGEHSEELYIHTREVMIALDLSRSMQFGTARYSKKELTAIIAACLVFSAIADQINTGFVAFSVVADGNR